MFVGTQPLTVLTDAVRVFVERPGLAQKPSDVVPTGLSRAEGTAPTQQLGRRLPGGAVLPLDVSVRKGPLCADADTDVPPRRGAALAAPGWPVSPSPSARGCIRAVAAWPRPGVGKGRDSTGLQPSPETGSGWTARWSPVPPKGPRGRLVAEASPTCVLPTARFCCFQSRWKLI